MLVFKAYVLPAHPLVVAAVFGIGKKSHDRVYLHLLKEPGQLNALEQFDLLRGTQIREFIFCPGLKRGETFLVKRLFIFVKRGERAINEIDHASFARAGRVVGWNNLGSNGFDFQSLFCGEEFKFDLPLGFGGFVRVLPGGQNFGPTRGEPGGADPCARSDEKYAARDFFFIHKRSRIKEKLCEAVTVDGWKIANRCSRCNQSGGVLILSPTLKGNHERKQSY